MRLRRRALLLAACGFALLLLAVNPLLRRLIEHSAADYLRPTLTIGGLEWQFRPHFGLTLTNLALHGKDSPSPAATLDKLTLTFHGFALPDLAARGLALTLTPPRLTADYWVEPQPPSDEPPALPKLTLENARLEYRPAPDAPSQLFATLPHLSLAAPTLATALHLQTAEGSTLPPAQLTLTAAAQFTPDYRALTRADLTLSGHLDGWQLNPAQLRLNHLPLTAPALPAHSELTASAHQDLPDGERSLTLDAQGDAQTVAVNIQLQQNGQPAAHATLRLPLPETGESQDGQPQLTLPHLALRLTLPLACRPGLPLELDLSDTNLRYQPRDGAVSLATSGTLDGAPLHLTLQHRPAARPPWRLEGKLQRFDAGNCGIQTTPLNPAPTKPSNPTSPIPPILFTLADLAYVKLSIESLLSAGIQAHNLQVCLSP